MCFYTEVRLVFHCSHRSQEWPSSSLKMLPFGQYLNSTDCLDYITIDYSWSIDTTSDVGTRLGELNPIQLTLKPAATSTKQLRWSASSLTQHTANYLPAAPPTRCHRFLSWICKCSCRQITSCIYSTRLNNATLMNELLMCESVVHSWVATNKASDIPTSETFLKNMHILIESNSYKQRSFLKASTVI